MPSKKQFEFLTLTIPFTTNYMDMYELAENRLEIIKQLFRTIEEKKESGYIAIAEIPEEDSAVFGFWKNGNNFIIENRSKNYQEEMEPIEFFNWIFKKAPFISVVGRGSR